MLQRTLRNSFEMQGVGVHTGAHCRVKVLPAHENSGRVFRVGDSTIPGKAEYISGTTRSTTLSCDGATVQTVEHLLSALYAFGVDNAIMEVTGPEIPILDGSALPFVEAILCAGIEHQTIERRNLALANPVEVREGNSIAIAVPSETLDLTVEMEYLEWPEGNATVNTLLDTENVTEYKEFIAPARTFVFKQEAEELQRRGLGMGGTLENALVILPPHTFSSPLRMPSEWCAHKMLDLIGDLALVDAYLSAKLTVKRPGHRINTTFARAVVEGSRAVAVGGL